MIPSTIRCLVSGLDAGKLPRGGAKVPDGCFKLAIIAPEGSLPNIPTLRMTIVPQQSHHVDHLPN